MAEKEHGGGVRRGQTGAGGNRGIHQRPLRSGMAKPTAGAGEEGDGLRGRGRSTAGERKECGGVGVWCDRRGAGGGAWATSWRRRSGRRRAGGRRAGGGVPGACGQATVGRQRGARPDGSGSARGVCLDGGGRAASCRAGGGVSGEAAAAGEGELGGG
eukprot:XP_020397918.1 glycine-rich cell wall structural protein 1-like [Zea mays]